MQLKFLIIPSVLLMQVSSAQVNVSPATTPATVTTPPAPATSTPVTPAVSPVSESSAETPRVRIEDYKSVFEAPTVEDEVKMATERFSLTNDQQEMWLVAATDRRQAEKQAYDKLGSKSQDYQKASVYSGLRSSLTTFHETVVGHLSPSQKQALESDRLILEEKRQRLAKLPPPPPPAPTVTAAPVDSSAIKQAEKDKKTGKKSKKKKKATS